MKLELTPKARGILAMSRSLAKEAAQEISSISYLLHPPMLEEFGLGYVLRWYLRGFRKRSGIDVNLTIGPNLDRLPREVEIAVFRIVQEALTNVSRHSGSKRAQIRFAVQNRNLTIEVQDFGGGLRRRASQPVETVGLGIASMRERLEQLGGKLELRSGAEGTLVLGTIPIDETIPFEKEAA
jgi:signal transduction histidine kinase